MASDIETSWSMSFYNHLSPVVKVLLAPLANVVYLYVSVLEIAREGVKLCIDGSRLLILQASTNTMHSS